MADPWTADFNVTRELARSLIGGQFTEIRIDALEPFAEGWDNTAFLVNGELVFRFPRRYMAANLLEREAHILPILAPRLPVPIPNPEWIGAPTDSYPWVFAGYRILPGVTADRRNLSESQRAALAPQLGRFLAALHRIPVDDAVRAWAPADELKRADITYRAPKLSAALHRIQTPENAPHIKLALKFVESLHPEPYTLNPGPWIHGDLYSRHLLVHDSGNLAGIIDWGDVHLGDPAIDLSIAFSYLPPAARNRFRQEYGEIDDHTWERARFRALQYAPILIEYGRSTNDPDIESAGHHALELATEN